MRPGLRDDVRFEAVTRMRVGNAFAQIAFLWIIGIWGHLAPDSAYLYFLEGDTLWQN